MELIIFGHPIYLAQKTKIKYPKPVNDDLKRKTAESPLEDFFLKKRGKGDFPHPLLCFVLSLFRPSHPALESIFFSLDRVINGGAESEPTFGKTTMTKDDKFGFSFLVRTHSERLAIAAN